MLVLETSVQGSCLTFDRRIEHEHEHEHEDGDEDGDGDDARIVATRERRADRDGAP